MRLVDAFGVGAGCGREYLELGSGAGFADDLVEGLAVGDGAVDEFGVDVVFEEDLLCGAGFFVGPLDEARGELFEQVEDFGGNLDGVDAHIDTLSPFWSAGWLRCMGDAKVGELRGGKVQLAGVEAVLNEVNFWWWRAVGLTLWRERAGEWTICRETAWGTVETA